MNIIPLKDLAKGAFGKIKQFQNGEIKPIVTGREYLDTVFPLINGSVVTIAAGSGVGKSYELALVAENVMGTELNPNADNFVMLSVSLEMKMLSLVLRGLSKKLKKSKRSILEAPPATEEEKAIINAYYKMLKDKRHYISQEPTTPGKFVAGCRKFLEEHRDKETVFITADHLALFNGDRSGQGQQQIIEELIKGTNELKMEFENVIFIFLSQLNGEMLKRMKDKDNYSQPRDTDIYYSGFIFQVSDYVMVKVNPYKMGINEYTKINAKRYSHLTKFFSGPPDRKGRVSLRTLGMIYFHLLKCRDAEDGFYTDIFAEELNIPNKDYFTESLNDDEPEDNDAPKFDSKKEVSSKTEPESYNTAALQAAAGTGFDTPGAYTQEKTSAEDDEDDVPF